MECLEFIIKFVVILDVLYLSFDYMYSNSKYIQHE